MTSPSFFTVSLRLGTVALVSATALVGCSTVKSLSPFGSNVPYSQDIQPTVPRPAEVEIPAFKPVPKPPAPPKPPEPEAAPPPPAPAAAPPPAAPAAAPPPAAAAPASPPPAPQSAAPEAAPAPKVAAAQPVAPAASAPAAPAATPEPAKTAEAESAGDADTDSAPQIPAEHRQFKDDGTYPNLAQVPARPVNLPTFADAKKTELALEADNSTAKTASPDSPAAPAVDSTPDKASAGDAVKPLQAASVTPAGAIERSEDRAPCLGTDPANSELATTIHFATGSAAMTAADLEVLAEAMPTVRGAKGTIRVFGHGDIDPKAAQLSGRFDLAAARAGAVAQALAGFGIPVHKIAVGVACQDAATAGASVQLYAES